MDDASDELLLLLEIRLRNFYVVLTSYQQRLDELEQLARDFHIVDGLVQVNYGLADLDGHLASLLEWQVLHQVRVLVHRED